MSRLKAVKPKNAEPSKPKIIVFGEAGVGKTWTALDFPATYYIDTEGGANLARYTTKLDESGGVYFGVEQGSQDFKTVIEQVEALATEDHPYKTVVIDSLSKLFLIEEAKEELRLTRANKDTGYGAAKKPAVALTRRLLNWIDRIDMNVIMIAHETTKWKDNKADGSKFDAWDKLAYELHLNLQIVKQAETRRAFIRKTRLEEFPDGSNFVWSYEEFAKRYGKEILESGSKKIDLATPEQVAEIRALLEVIKMSDEDIEKALQKRKASKFEDLSTTDIIDMIKNLKGRIA